MLDYAADLMNTVETTARTLAAVSPEAAGRRPAPGKWSAKEIIGHLVDSASNNHQRFVRARWRDDLVFPTYDQDGWVTAQRYDLADWRELLALWRSFNVQIARVMETTPDDVRLREHRRHNLDQVAWQAVPAGEPATLDYFMRDYVGHLHHHLRQIAALVQGAPGHASGASVRIRPATRADVGLWGAMRNALWPDCTPEIHAHESEQLLADPEKGITFLAEDERDGPIAFVELSVRPYAEACHSGHVGYVEGWYVDPRHRRRGIGRALFAAADDWARQRGCLEMASDTDVDNTLSRAAHARLGYGEVGTLVHFRKPLAPDPLRPGR